ncbi:MAG: alpha/beta fold hydrolase [Deltaproteobacteria bacterium]|nr:alpha/beta fold hydrolase [Deltaproteobacteria bacterium]
MEHHVPDTLVTGATGLIGRNLLVSLTARGRTVAAVVRRAAARAEELAAYVADHGGDPARLQVLDGDLTVDGLGLSAALPSVRDVFHCAGLFAFGLSPAQAAAINVDGSLAVVRWAAALPRLRRLVYVGGYRMTVLPPWVGDSTPRGSVRARLYRTYGPYEASKIEANLAVRDLARARAVPLTEIHPSTVIGRSDSGHSDQTIGMAETFGRLWRGQLPASIGRAHTFIPLVTADYLADFMAQVVERPETESQSLVVLDPQTPELPQLVLDAARHLGVPAPRLRLPVGLVRALPRALSGVDPEGLSFASEDRYDTRTADAHADAVGLVRPDIRIATTRWLDHLVSSRFGDARHVIGGRLRDVAGSRTFCVGDPLVADRVMLHGLPWDGESWRPLQRTLRGSAARPDLPGVGRSSVIPGRAPGDTTGWLDALLAQRQAPVELVAHSLGCEAALHYAAANPTGITRLVLVSPFFVQPRAPWLARRPWLVAANLRRTTDAALRASLIPGVAAAEPVDDAIASAAAQLARSGVALGVGRALARASRRSVRARLTALLNEVAQHTPTLVIHGEDDPLVGATGAATVCSIPGAAHSVSVSHPRAVAAAMARHRNDSGRQAGLPSTRSGDGTMA